jgi:hypothetical protein
MNKNTDNNNLNEFALLVGVASLLLTASQILAPVTLDVLLRAMALGQIINLIAVALLAAIIYGKSSNNW